MAKIKKIIPIKVEGGEQNARKKVLVFCMDNALAKQIVQQLQRNSLLVWFINEEKKLLSALDQADPELILIEINAPTNRPLDKIVAEIFVWMRTRARAINKFLDTPSQYLWQYSKIVLFESESPLTPTRLLAAEMADTDELVRLCSLLGDVKYIGIYSPFSFMSKLRPLLENSYG